LFPSSPSRDETARTQVKEKQTDFDELPEDQQERLLKDAEEVCMQRRRDKGANHIRIKMSSFSDQRQATKAKSQKAIAAAQNSDRQVSTAFILLI
jgi:hypothetical protein